MLKMARLYEEEIATLFVKVMFEEKYKFANASCYRDELKLEDSTWRCHQFVSVNENNKVVGWIEYKIDRETSCAYAFQAMNFEMDSLSTTFAKDLIQAIEDVFLKFGFLKMKFSVIIGNPAETFYDKYIEKIGGRVVGYYKDEVRLIDGKLYDMKVYEVMRDNFINRPKDKRS